MDSAISKKFKDLMEFLSRMFMIMINRNDIKI